MIGAIFFRQFVSMPLPLSDASFLRYLKIDDGDLIQFVLSILQLSTQILDLPFQVADL
jgi:hypothetical protein